MNVSEIIAKSEGLSIKPDRYGMAAISYIFKAFGDNIRSKEYWPWGKDYQCPWTSTKGAEEDLTIAMQLLDVAKTRLDYDAEDTTKPIGTRTLKERITTNILQSNSADVISNRINETSRKVNERISKIENYE